MSDAADPRTRLVAAGYDAMIDTWEAWSAQIHDEAREEWTADLIRRLPPAARVLELGCGGASRETESLAARFALTGVDLSARQLERARERVPQATFIHADLTDLDLAPASGAPSFFSSFPPDHNARIVREAGFESIRDEVIAMREPEGTATFQWVLAAR